MQGYGTGGIDGIGGNRTCCYDVKKACITSNTTRVLNQRLILRGLTQPGRLYPSCGRQHVVGRLIFRAQLSAMVSGYRERN